MSETASEPAIKVAVVPVTAFQQNASIIWCTRTNEAAIVDPGGDVPKLIAAVKELAVTPTAIWLTHGHIDHAGGAAELAEALSLPIIGPHRDDQFLMDNLVEQGRMFGIGGSRAVTPGRYLAQGDTVSLGEAMFATMHVPGHSPGSVVFYHEPSRFMLAGDTLFQGSIGRTDFPYGDHAQFIREIKAKLMTLPDDVTFLPGHGPASTIGAERAGNPFIR
ncbi:MAG: MBL fold metallo-hydrolase [Bosea sp.]|jgi:glyoxylase-like metal-dependent hydrolase (beta-lactamase superfamily II)|nr:MBL fold metallo-hydrolase [Bosea sp. (in: a-proteobacteria)]